MKVKELLKTVNIAWSPAEQCPITLAAGTAAQMLDTSFNTNSVLELYSLNLSDPSYDLELIGSQPSPRRFHKLIWSPYDFKSQVPNGVIVGGCESGHIQIYNVSKLLAGEEALVAQQDKHNGSVRSLDYNPFQSNLIASGASESEIFIWDLNNTTIPMTPGQKSQPFEDVSGVYWNRQVQHILASLFPTRCIIWDLRKNEQIIKLTDTQSRVRWHTGQWSVDVATQLWLASEDDANPVVQLWDLRYATSPARTLNIHTRGVLGMTWCPKDPELMVSCGKDNKLICWNGGNQEHPDGEILSEISSTTQWYSDLAWCPRNPALIAASSFEGNVSIYSVFGGTQQQVQTTSKIVDSFPGMDPIQPEPIPQQNATHIVSHDLKHPPKWIKRPSGISFGFGGKIVSFDSTSKSVNLHQLITNESFVKRSSELESVLNEGNFADYCRRKADETTDQHSKYVWFFLKAYFEENPTAEILNLLGYQADDIASKFSKYTEKLQSFSADENNVDGIADRMANLSHNAENAAFDLLGKMNGVDGKKHVPFKLSTENGTEGLICEAILTGNIPAAVELCMESGRSTDAIILAMTGGSELLARTQYRYLKNSDSYISNLITALVTEDWSGVISQCTIDSWKESLVAVLTHSKNQSSSLLCERLGERLQIEADGDLSVVKNALLCYICAGSIERIVDVWETISNTEEGSAVEESAEFNKLVDLVEVVVLLNKALERQGKNVAVSGKYAELLSKYASLLAAQGSLNMALTFIGNSQDDPHVVDLRERLYHALGHKQQQQQQQVQQVQQVRPDMTTANRFAQPRGSIGALTPGYGQSQSQPPMPNSYSMQQPTFNTGMPGQIPQPNNVPTSPPQVPTIPQSSWNTAPLTAKPPPVATVTDNMSLPPRPPSTSSVNSGSGQISGSGLTRKYPKAIDPSITSGSYGQSPATMYGNTYNSPPQQPFNSPMMQPVQPQQQQPTMFNPMPSATPTMANQVQSPTNFMNPQQYNFNTTAPSVANNNLPPPPSQSAQIQRNPTPEPGWNDPPELSASRLKPRKDVPQAAPAPITHPIFGAIDPRDQQQQQQQQMYDPNYQQPGQQSSLYAGQYIPLNPQSPMNVPPPPRSTSGTPGLATGYQQTQSSNQINYNNFQTTPTIPQQQQFQPTIMQPQQPPSQPTPPPSHARHEPVKKMPLPEEFIYMQTVFEELKMQCINTSTNPQTKRKLDDVSKRLEMLYDLLRENKLSDNTLKSLNQLVQLIQIGDYGNCLGLHTQMVSGPDFSRISSFMPGIKILLQLAMQLQVYLR